MSEGERRWERDARINAYLDLSIGRIVPWLVSEREVEEGDPRSEIRVGRNAEAVGDIRRLLEGQDIAHPVEIAGQAVCIADSVTSFVVAPQPPVLGIPGRGNVARELALGNARRGEGDLDEAVVLRARAKPCDVRDHLGVHAWQRATHGTAWLKTRGSNRAAAVGDGAGGGVAVLDVTHHRVREAHRRTKIWPGVKRDHHVVGTRLRHVGSLECEQ